MPNLTSYKIVLPLVIVVLTIVYSSPTLLIESFAAQKSGVGPRDTKQPELQIISPANGSNVPAGIILVQGTASDNGSGVKTVGVKVDSHEKYTLATATTSGYATWEVAISLSSVGSHNLIATAVDKAGNVRSRSEVVYAVDSTPPSIIPPADISETATGPLTVVTLGTPIVSDNIDPAPVATNNASASSEFPVGTTVVEWK